MILYIAYPTIKVANMNNSNLAQDLRKSLGLVDEAPLHIDDRTFNELVSTKRTLYKLIIHIG